MINLLERIDIYQVQLCELQVKLSGNNYSASKATAEALVLIGKLLHAQVSLEVYKQGDKS
tara:strand:- start:675 stop:854 length:180 start_codon:yes stop_codon:yes gene_type:complete